MSGRLLPLFDLTKHRQCQIFPDINPPKILWACGCEILPLNYGLGTYGQSHYTYCSLGKVLQDLMLITFSPPRAQPEVVGVNWESWAMFYILYHSAEMKGRIPKLNVVSETLEGLLALYNMTVGPIAAVYPQEGYWKNGKMAQLSLHWGELSHHCRRVVPP